MAPILYTVVDRRVLFSCASRQIMETTRMHIVALLLYTIAITKVSSNGPCDGDWTYSFGSCYSPNQYPPAENLTGMQQHCKDMGKDSHLVVFNTKEEIVAGIENGIFGDGWWVCQGMTSDDNGTTWTKFDGSSEETYIETLRPYNHIMIPTEMVCCKIYLAPNLDYCNSFSAAYQYDFYCEKTGPYVNSGPCDVKIHQKLRKGATRTISFKNTKIDMCYIELWRSLFRPAQIKIYGYNFPSTSSTCSQGFFVQNNGEVIDYLHKDKLTCGNNGGPKGPLIRKRSERGGKIRLYIAMNGDGRRVWLRTKGRSFRY